MHVAFTYEYKKNVNNQMGLCLRINKSQMMGLIVLVFFHAL